MHVVVVRVPHVLSFVQIERHVAALPLAARYLVMSPASGIRQAGTGEGSFSLMAVKLHMPSVLVSLIEPIQIWSIDC
jgi:hypothetical protein